MSRTKKTKRKNKAESGEGNGGVDNAQKADPPAKKPRHQTPESIATREEYRMQGLRSIFVNGLLNSTTEATLRMTFGDKVSEIKLPEKQNRTKRHAIIIFESEEAADEAIAAYPDGVEVDGHTLTLSYVGEKQRKFSKTVQVRCLSKATTVESLKDKLGAEAVKFHYFDQQGQRPTGNATCLFASHAEGQKAIDKFNNKTLDGRKITLLFNSSELEKWQYGVAVCVRNIGEDITEESLTEKFEGCTHVQLIKDHKTSKCKMAYISFENQVEAAKAIQMHNGTECAGKVLAVDFRINRKRKKGKGGKKQEEGSGEGQAK